MLPPHHETFMLKKDQKKDLITKHHTFCKPPARFILIIFPCVYSLSHTQILSCFYQHLSSETETSPAPATHSFLPVYFHLNQGVNRYQCFSKMANTSKHLRKIKQCYNEKCLTKQMYQAYNQVKKKKKKAPIAFKSMHLCITFCVF